MSDTAALVIEGGVAAARLPVAYEQAKVALAACAKIDECRDWADRAKALASYAKQADDDDLLKHARRIQARAVRRCGELLKMYNSQGRRTDQPSEGGHGKSQQEAADEAGLSEHQQLQAVRVANTPESDFEKATESDIPATVTDLAEMGKQSRANIRPDTPPGFTEASKLIGSVRRFAAFCDEQEAVHVAGGVLSSEATEIRALVGTIDEWLDRFIVHLGEIQ